jgi:hypothetical protein
MNWPELVLNAVFEEPGAHCSFKPGRVRRHCQQTPCSRYARAVKQLAQGEEPGRAAGAAGGGGGLGPMNNVTPMVWLEKMAPGFALVPTEDRSAILDFTLLWIRSHRRISQAKDG